MPSYITKYNFSAGEISDLATDRQELDRTRNGCYEMRNAIVRTQGPATRRSGFAFTYSLSGLGLDPADQRVRLVPFIFNKLQSYVLVFFKHTSGKIRCVFATQSGLLVYPSPVPTECPTGHPITVTAGSIVYLDMPTGWSIDDFYYAQTGDFLYIAQSTLKPHAIKRYGETCWTVEELTFANQPAEWSALNGWPETVTFVQQRLAFAGTKTNRQTVWLSRSGDMHNFGKLGTTIVDSDAITFTLDSGTQDKIVWLKGTKNLHLGTIANEWTVTGNGQTAMTPVAGVLTESPTNQGSEPLMPLRIGMTLVFLEQHGRVVNEFLYDYNYDSYKSTDITILAPHLTEEKSIIRWTYQQTPNSIVWAVREDGALLGLTYQRQHGVVAWHQHDTDGEFLDVCAIPGQDREDDLWAAVKRNVNGVDVVYLEKKYPEFIGESVVNSRFLDSALVYSGASTNSITGLTHLIGKSVSVLADGSFHPNVTVSGTGSITLNRMATNVLVGLAYESVVSPILPEVQRADGSGLNRLERLLGAYISLYKSLGFMIRVRYSDGTVREFDKPFRRGSNPVDAPLPLFTGVYDIEGVLGTDRGIKVSIVQKQPLPLTIKSITLKTEVK